MDAGGTGTGIVVGKENVLEIGAAFQAEARRLDELVGGLAERMVTRPALGDPASVDYAEELNQRLTLREDSYTARARGYVAELRGIARQCEASARAYGFTDDEIAAAFGKGG
ncbi:hypothetical protein [Saccharothrix syringae]|uniref:PE domain-containing protein n=1 Tax=Saccharothrix syringae TaxID=103733 RepID=A0A5Q0GWW6_SACSY|nr:hypothetical protein [Saccharothrix syringae]QFZ18383.1 hypothetical protein EKG83_13610 [Saccharothrix syringae]